MKKLTISAMALAMLGGIALPIAANAAPMAAGTPIAHSEDAVTPVRMTPRERMMMRHHMRHRMMRHRMMHRRMM